MVLLSKYISNLSGSTETRSKIGLPILNDLPLVFLALAIDEARQASPNQLKGKLDLAR